MPFIRIIPFFPLTMILLLFRLYTHFDHRKDDDDDDDERVNGMDKEGSEREDEVEDG